MLNRTLSFIKRFIPKPLFAFFQPPYHYGLAFLGALLYGFPSKKLFVIGVTGTKGKTTTAELINTVLEETGFATALADTVRFKIADVSEDNLYKMTLPGRFFIQRFLAKAVAAKCTHAVVEVSSEATIQFRDRFLYLDALVFTNLAPEHIESHGSYENYVAAKLHIGKRVLSSKKPRQILVLNKDDKEAKRFEDLNIPEVYRFGFADAAPCTASPEGTTFTFQKLKMWSRLPGEFNVYNMLAALTLGRALRIDGETMKRAIEKFPGVRGRAQKISAGQPFSVIIDYAHTPDSLEALYKAYPALRKICVLSGTGGGRDRSKRPAMGAVAGKYCDTIILTDEDPYDENPRAIVEEIKNGIPKNAAAGKVLVEMDRRAAIAAAFRAAKKNDVVLITGKGTDPYIMGPRGLKTPWSDARVAEEELRKLS